MPITPLPQFEADLADLQRARRIDALVDKGFSRDELSALPDEDLIRFERKAPPRTLVVRFGAMKLVGEFPYRGDVTPGCGSKLVVKTHRGTELGEMLTSTCPNSGCSKSVSRRELLEYVENSGGRDYPFFSDGRVLRPATPEDLDHQARLEQSRHALKVEAREVAHALGTPLKVVDAEPILGGERLTFYYAADDRADTRPLRDRLEKIHRVRVDLRPVQARDEARLTADYERCGQYCCCKNFLKVLKPVSMKSAKVQKATLDPLTISGRCGRLMCCLRYEDATYEELKKNLPRHRARVGTPEGEGVVVDTQILTQLVLVELAGSAERRAFPVEEIGPPGLTPQAPIADARPTPASPQARSSQANSQQARSPQAQPTRPARSAPPAIAPKSHVGHPQPDRAAPRSARPNTTNPTSPAEPRPITSPNSGPTQDARPTPDQPIPARAKRRRKRRPPADPAPADPANPAPPSPVAPSLSTPTPTSTTTPSHSPSPTPSPSPTRKKRRKRRPSPPGPTDAPPQPPPTPQPPMIQ